MLIRVELILSMTALALLGVLSAELAAAVRRSTQIDRSLWQNQAMESIIGESPSLSGIENNCLRLGASKDSLRQYYYCSAPPYGNDGTDAYTEQTRSRLIWIWAEE